VILALLLAPLPAAPGALAGGAAPSADLPFTFIPREFQGKWVLSEYEYAPIGPSPPTEPDYFIGKIIEIGNRSVTFFGHTCAVKQIGLQYVKGDPRRPDFDKHQIPDADIKEVYPFSQWLHVYCESWPDPVPSGPEALFLGYEGGPRGHYFALFDPSARFITTSMVNGPSYILRPVE